MLSVVDISNQSYPLLWQVLQVHDWRMDSQHLYNFYYNRRLGVIPCLLPVTKCRIRQLNLYPCVPRALCSDQMKQEWTRILLQESCQRRYYLTVMLYKFTKENCDSKKLTYIRHIILFSSPKYGQRNSASLA